MGLKTIGCTWVRLCRHILAGMAGGDRMRRPFFSNFLLSNGRVSCPQTHPQNTAADHSHKTQSHDGIDAHTHSIIEEESGRERTWLHFLHSIIEEESGRERTWLHFLP